MEQSLDQTIALTFQHLDAVLARGLEISPVQHAGLLLQLIPECSDEARCLMLAELIKLDMARAAEHGLSRRLNFYAPALKPQFPAGHLPLDVVLQEIQILRRAGEEIRVDHYQQAYPHLSAVLDDVLTHRTLTTAPSPLTTAPSFEEGQQVDDFTILRTLGRGAFASVYLARQNSMHRLVALKVSLRGSDEPIALSQLDHPSIVRVYDQRRLSDPPVILLYMQFVPGGTLAEVIRATAFASPTALTGRALLDAIDQSLYSAGQQPPERSDAREQLAAMNWPQLVAWLGVHLAEGLAAAHRAGILHRDVKPANVLLAADGIPKLADFNVSFSGLDGCAGAAVHFGGSLAYMSPEQLEIADPVNARAADQLDYASDVYSVAIVLWELWQGARPVPATEMISNWLSAIDQQKAMRRGTPITRRTFAGSAERVLERTLRSALHHKPQSRPSAIQLAGKLRLALIDQAAALFEPAPESWLGQLRRWPVLLVTALIIFLPNGLAGLLNYQYNYSNIHSRYPHLESSFVKLSIAVNFIFFPVGALLLIWLAGQVGRAMRRAERGQAVQPMEIDGAWNLGHRAAMVGGLLWMIAGVAFPAILMSWDRSFTWYDAAEFFLSLAICGGFAWIYPFFGVSIVATQAYYPALIASTMTDAGYAARAASLKRRTTNYLLTAAAIPLCALALLTLRRANEDMQDLSNIFLLIVVVLTAVALPFAFVAHQRLQQTIDLIKRVFNT